MIVDDNNKTFATGLSLVELLVVLVILSILAGAALPFAELNFKRHKELELKRNLRSVRSAIDQFHKDWVAKRLSSIESAASDDGYPKTLDVLVTGVTLEGTLQGKRRYLRRIPINPFAAQTLPAQEQWRLLSYRDPVDTHIWGGYDVYDITVNSDNQAIDGSRYRDW